ncbi:uncharacterized protein LOC136064778 [Quercus suber]|uniref:uncharacterized protein LOC136064778 n=1 Tax=Quercus suber TaxID=58331 RepID=UPI0032E050ED
MPKGIQENSDDIGRPHTMVALIPEKPLLLYIANTQQSLGALLAQEQEGVEKQVYYISRLMKGSELRYSTAEKEQEWSMYLDGSFTFQGGGIEVVLKAPREEHTFAYKLHFPFSNNEAKYEALLVGLKATRRLAIKRLKVFGDYELVIRQLEGIYGVKNPSLVAYKATVQRIMEHFTFIEYKVVNKGENKLANSLATLATKSVLKKEKMTL